MIADRIKLVGSGDYEEYPISCAERLDTHYFVQFNFDRYDRSNFRRLSYRDPEVGFFGMELFFKSHGESPLGTLPDDDEELAFLLGLPLDRWMSLRERKFHPLYNWHRVRCDNGEIRLAHPVVTEVMQAALAGHKEHKASNEEKATSQRLNRLKLSLRDIGCEAALYEDGALVGWIDGWLLKHHSGQRRRPQLDRSLSRALNAARDAGVLGAAFRSFENKR